MKRITVTSLEKERLSMSRRRVLMRIFGAETKEVTGCVSRIA
jgi:hypothetical protein